jgi:toxin YoeB
MAKYIVQISKSAQKDLVKIYKSGNKSDIERLSRIIEELSETPYTGIGNPEKLRFDLAGFWSRRINKKDRLIYSVEESIVTVTLVSALGHYFDR